MIEFASEVTVYQSALLGGNRNSDGGYNNLGNNGNYWSSTEMMIPTLGTTTSTATIRRSTATTIIRVGGVPVLSLIHI